MRVGFLFNHDAAHQVMHSAPAAFELARRYPEMTVSLLTTTKEEAQVVKEVAADFTGVPCHQVMLTPPSWSQTFDRLTGHALLAKRFGVLWRHREFFRSLDMLVVPDKTSLLLKRWLGANCPLMVHTFHGAGDRAGGFKGIEGFDFCLLPGRKYETRMLAEGRIRRERSAVVGYAKLDRYRNAPQPKLFDNARPTVLYTPHFDPGLSSWYGWGKEILDYFAKTSAFNLIFAPHVLLFRRRWHISTEGGLPRLTPPVPDFVRGVPHILVDTGSAASVDMTYTRAADIYLGDMSSQVYEFLYRPRPCIFLNRSGAAWREDENFRCWKTGDVVDSVDALPAALEAARTAPDRYRAVQEREFAEAFDLADTPSAVRAADALAGFLAAKNGSV